MFECRFKAICPVDVSDDMRGDLVQSPPINSPPSLLIRAPTFGFANGLTLRYGICKCLMHLIYII
jgi:hypothetical protein